MTEELEDQIDHMALHFVGGRITNQPSHAKDSRYYGDPAKVARFGKKKGGEVERQTDREQADTLLMEWFRWTKLYRPNLGAPKIAPYCKQSISSKQYDDHTDLTHDRVYQIEMQAIEYCVDTLPVPLQQAIGTEMRNREVKVKVWRDPGNRGYTEALVLIVPVMKKRGLFE